MYIVEAGKRIWLCAAYPVLYMTLYWANIILEHTFDFLLYSTNVVARPFVAPASG